MWYGQELRLGVDVREKEGRHVGVIRARVDGLWKVEWRNGWISLLSTDELERVHDE